MSECKNCPNQDWTSYTKEEKIEALRALGKGEATERQKHMLFGGPRVLQIITEIVQNKIK